MNLLALIVMSSLVRLGLLYIIIIIPTKFSTCIKRIPIPLNNSQTTVYTSAKAAQKFPLKFHCVITTILLLKVLLREWLEGVRVWWSKSCDYLPLEALITRQAYVCCRVCVGIMRHVGIMSQMLNLG